MEVLVHLMEVEEMEVVIDFVFGILLSFIFFLCIQLYKNTKKLDTIEVKTKGDIKIGDNIKCISTEILHGKIHDIQEDGITILIKISPEILTKEEDDE